MIIDAKDTLLGRLSSYAAKQALLGNQVDVINCEECAISGKKYDVLDTYIQKIHRKAPGKGPFFYRRPDMLIRRTIRGMLSHKQARGREAHKRVMCYNKIPKDTLYYDDTKNQIYFGTKSCSHIFTLQEFKIISHLLKQKGAVVSRDEVANVLWGEDALDKYSDWTIDKTISTIRKKLNNIGFASSKLITLKKRGFSFSS